MRFSRISTHKIPLDTKRQKVVSVFGLGRLKSYYSAKMLKSTPVSCEYIAPVADCQLFIVTSITIYTYCIGLAWFCHMTNSVEDKLDRARFVDSSRCNYMFWWYKDFDFLIRGKGFKWPCSGNALHARIAEAFEKVLISPLKKLITLTTEVFFGIFIFSLPFLRNILIYSPRVWKHIYEALNHF